MKRTLWIVVVALAFTIGVAMPVVGQTFTVVSSAVLAPDSIPLDSSGDPPAQVAMSRIDLSNGGDAVNLFEVASMEVTLTGTASIDSITAIRIYWEEQDNGITNDGIFGGGVELGSVTSPGASPVTITLSDINYVTKGPSNKAAMFYVVYEFVDHTSPNALTQTDTVGAQVTKITWRPDGGGTTTDYTTPLPASPTFRNVDDYEMTMVATTSGLTFPSPTPGATVTALRLQFGVLDSSLSAAGSTLVSSITIDEINTAVAADIQEILIFGDTVANDVYDAVGDTLYGSAFVSAQSTVVPLTTPMTISDGDEFLVAVVIAAGASDGNVIQLEVPDPVTSSVVFGDSIDDSLATTQEYSQTGYLDPAYPSYESPTPYPSGSGGSFMIQPAPDTTEPNIIASSPVDAATGVSKDLAQVTITFDDVMYDDLGGGDPASVTTLANYTMTGPTAVSFTGVVFSSANRRSTLTIDPADLPLQYEGVYTVTVANVENTDGLAIQTGVNDSISFTIEQATPPEVTDTTPNDGALGVARDVTVEIVFSEAMNVGTLIEANFSMTDELAANVPGTFSVVGDRTISFAPDSLLAYDVTYTVELASSNIFDAEGESLDTWTGATHPYSFSFRTVPNVPPTVLATIPANGVTDASIGTTVSIVFSEPMDETSVLDDANFSLIETGETVEVSGTLSYTPEANTLSFTPDMAFSYSTEYTGTVTTGVTDADGTPIGEDYTFTFTTASAAESLTFTDIIVANNRIEPGSTDPMRIFLEVPEGVNGTDPVTIAVYTTNGRRVATLTTANETYDDVIARQPIIWDGTNGRGQNLGPGLYFVQVSSAGYRRALRVMIVR